MTGWRAWLAGGLAVPMLAVSCVTFPSNTPDVQALAHPEIAAIAGKKLQITQLVFVDKQPRGFTADVTLERYEVFAGGWEEVGFHKWDLIELPAPGTQGNLVWDWAHCQRDYYRVHIRVSGVTDQGDPWGPEAWTWPEPHPGSKKIHGVKIKRCIK